MQKIKKSIYIKPETVGILEYQAKKYDKKISELIEEKLQADYGTPEDNSKILLEENEELKRRLNILAAQEKRNTEILIAYLEKIWLGLHIENIPLNNQALNDFKDSLKKDLNND